MPSPPDKTSLYLQQIQAVMPTLAIKEVEVNNEGLVNDVLIINRQRVFRFPKHDWATLDLHHEAKCLALAHAHLDHLDMRLPEWTIYEGNFISYEFIPGIPLQRNDILRHDEERQEELAAQLGTFLQQLHSIPMAAVKADQIQPSVTVRSHKDWLKLYEDVQRELFPLLMDFAQTWVHELFAPLLADEHFMAYEPSFVNGDLASYHLLYNPSTCRLNGIIDFGTAGIGDPAVDFACLLDQYGEHFVRRIATYYPKLPNLIERARFLAGTLELQWALGGIRSNDRSWFTVHIGRARDVMPIGSGL